MATEHDNVGSNSADMTPEERRALFFDHYRPIAAQADRVREANVELKRLRKLAKSEGIVLADVDFALRCAEIDDSDIIVGELRRRTQIASWMALPVDFQAELFGADEREPIEDKAFKAGALASSLGKNADPSVDGYDITSPPGQAWMRGHAEDQRRLRDAMQKRMEAANAAARGQEPAAAAEPKKKRGRPRKSSIEAITDGLEDGADVRPRFKKNDAGGDAGEAPDPFPEARGNA